MAHDRSVWLWEGYVEASSGRLWADADDIQEYFYVPLLFHFIIRFLGQGYLVTYTYIETK